MMGIMKVYNIGASLLLQPIMKTQIEQSINCAMSMCKWYSMTLFYTVALYEIFESSTKFLKDKIIYFT